jgi:hypothetical protein
MGVGLSEHVSGLCVHLGVFVQRCVSGCLYTQGAHMSRHVHVCLSPSVCGCPYLGKTDAGSVYRSPGFWVCPCLSLCVQGIGVRVCIQGCTGAHRGHGKGTHCLCNTGHLLSWFCFSFPNWLSSLLENKRSLKNLSPSCVPNAQNAA